MSDEPSELLTVAEAAAVLRLSQATVYALCAAKRLTHQRVGLGRGKIVIPYSAVSDYLNRGTVPSLEVPPGERTIQRVIDSWR